MIPFEVYSHYSLQEAFCHLDDLVAKAGELKLPGLILTDHNTLSGSIEFLEEIDKWNKKSDHKIKPGIGLSVDIGSDRLLLIAKNKDGFYDLIKILNTRQIAESKNLILILKSMDQYHKYGFGWKGQLFTSFDNNLGFPQLSGDPVFYINPEDSLYQKIIIASKLETTLNTIYVDIESEDIEYLKFFDDSRSFCLVKDWEKNNSLLLDHITVYSLNNKPNIPRLYENPDEKLREECRKGWKRLGLSNLIGSLKDRYVQQVEEELSVFHDAGISDYMLIVQDFMNYARNQGSKVGVRGSAGGSLVGYLLGLSYVDPLTPDPILGFAEERCLLFSRFINKGRFNKNNTSLPDIDVDLGIHHRERLIQYLKTKYGNKRVGHITTFNTMDGKGAIKEVFRILDPVANSFAIANEITKHMVDSSKIQDILEDLKEDDPKYNVIQYCIDHIPAIKEYYNEYKSTFDAAIKMANTIKSKGKHAAGIVISNYDLDLIAPVSMEDDNYIVDFEMVSLEKFGLVKYDILGVAAYEKIQKIEEMINKNMLMPIVSDEKVIINE